MAVIHMTEAEAAQDFAGVLAKVRAGDEVRIDEMIAVSSAGTRDPQRKTLSEAIRRARARNSDVTLDDQFERDLLQVITNHQHEGIRDPWAE